MPGEEKITTAALRALANNLDEVRNLLKEAGETVENGEVGGSSFSKYGLDMAVAYPSAHSFAVRDAARKEHHIETIQDRLRSTADTWDAAEAANTITPS
jgi:Excreted virulence factor EspC, type VII ESX diderm